MHTALGILAIAVTVLVVTAIAERIRFSAPLLLMLVGIGASFITFIHEPQLSPEVVLVGFLPPLLYAAAIRTSLIDFRMNRRPIAYLSVLLVVVTALGIGLITWLLLGVPFAVAFALGAVVAPPDAVAATSIARRVGLPRQLVTILEGESLVNDATAITCLRVAILAITATGGVTAGQITVGFLVAALGGLAIGFGVALVAIFVRKRVQEPVFDTAISLIVPFAAYLPAEFIGRDPFHGSGVIAVVTAGLMLGHKSPAIQSGQSRLSERINWSTIQFVLENTVFLLIGLQARRLVEAMAESEVSGVRIAVFCLSVLFGVIVLRLAWVALGRAFLFRRRGGEDDPRPPWSHSIVIGWAGLRGVVTLAAAFLIPVEVEQRELLVFAALVVTAGTLLLQGLTLPWLVRTLKIRGPDARSDALAAATVLQTASQAALAELDRITTDDDAPETVALVRERIASRPDALWEQLGRSESEAPAQQYRRLRLATLGTERNEVLKIRSTGKVDQDVLAEVLATFDIEESMLTIAADRSDRLAEDDVVPTPAGHVDACRHLDEAPTETETNGSDVCQDCVREGTRTVHLRICLTCGNVGCCDSSVGRHAERHHTNSHHPVMRSFEPGESWRWCYVDEQLG